MMQDGAGWCAVVHTGLARACGRVANDCTVVHTGMHDEMKLFKYLPRVGDRNGICHEWETRQE